MKQIVTIVGSGPSALLLASMLPPEQFQVTLYERNNAPARKFLVAGDGGLNLTHSETIDLFVTRYTPPQFLEQSLRSFSNTDLCNWLATLGVETFTGTSKRMYPVKGIKPIQVLQAILQRLKEKHVTLQTNYTWKGWKQQALVFEHKGEEILVTSNITVFALGGASWSKTGSDGRWALPFASKGIEIIPFEASNCTFEIKWPTELAQSAEGKWLKNIAVTCQGIKKSGEVVVTALGIEGGAIYALSPQIRQELKNKGEAKVYLDLKPAFSEEELLNKLQSGKKTTTARLKEVVKLSEVAIDLLRALLTKEQFTHPATLASFIKHLPLHIIATGPVEEAISTVGGIALAEVDSSFQLLKMPNHYVIGEMLNWDAPTGGYLLQACFSMGAVLARKLSEGFR